METYKVTVDEEGTIRWYNADGKLHRLNGPVVERMDGSKEYYKNGKLHREDGPAIEYSDGYKAYYKEGKKHREDGPAVEYDGGSKEYWINNKQLTEEEFNNRTKKELTVKQIEELLGYSIKVVRG